MDLLSELYVHKSLCGDYVERVNVPVLELTFPARCLVAIISYCTNVVSYAKRLDVREKNPGVETVRRRRKKMNGKSNF